MFNKNQGLVKDYVVGKPKRSRKQREPKVVTDSFNGEIHIYSRNVSRAELEELANWAKQGLAPNTEVNLELGYAYVHNFVSEHLAVGVGLWAKE